MNDGDRNVMGLVGMKCGSLPMLSVVGREQDCQVALQTAQSLANWCVRLSHSELANPMGPCLSQGPPSHNLHKLQDSFILQCKYKNRLTLTRQSIRLPTSTPFPTSFSIIINNDSTRPRNVRWIFKNPHTGPRPFRSIRKIERRMQRVHPEWV